MDRSGEPAGQLEARELVAEGLELSLGERAILDGVDLRLEPGASVALVGPNGAGKTTLLRVLSGLQELDGGAVRLGGRRLGDYARRALAAEMSMLPQARPQIYDFSALELVLMGFYARRRRRAAVPGEEELARAREALARMELERAEHLPARALSGGELQRALMARTLVSGAPIWLLDEPTASLDLRYQLLLLEEVEAHCARGGTALVALHDLELAARFFDLVICLQEGSLDAPASPREALTPERLARLFDVEFEVLEVDGRPIFVPLRASARRALA